MSVPQLPQDDINLFLHLKGIDVDFARARPDSKLEIKFKDESGLKYKSIVFKKPEPLHWECDIYVKSLTNAIISVQKSNIGPWKVVSEFHLDFNPSEVGDDKLVERKDDKSGVSMKLSFGRSKIGSDVTRLLADKAVSALATKVSMLEKLDQVLGYLDLVLQLGSGAAQLHPAAQVAIPIVTTVFKKFQEIPACHTELVSIMDDIVSMLPVLKLAHERVKDVEVQTLLRSFVDFVVHLSEELLQYSSRSPLKFVYQNWYRSKKGEVATLKDRLTQMKLSLSLGMNVDIKGAVSEIHLHQLSEADEKVIERLKPPGKSSYDPAHCCLPGTRASFLQDVGEWALSEDHSEQLYWIYGVAGCGKSSIAASVASDLKSKNVLCGSFFCKRDIPERRDPTRLVHTLAYFLAGASTHFRNVLLRLSKEDSIVVDKPLSALFKELIADPLAEVSQSAHSERVIIVLDALDECDENESMSSYLVRMIKLVPWLRLIVTSRPLQNIQMGLQRSGELMKSRDLFLVNTDEDILFFTRNQFKLNRRLPGNFSDAQIETLSRMASGHFQWIATVLEHVSRSRLGKVKLLLQILTSTPAASMAEERLDIVYLQVLDDTSKDAADKDAIRLMIGLIFVISRNRPLPAEALHTFIPSYFEVEQQELDALLQDLGSVLTTDPQTNAIRVCHPSFLDFIESQTRSKNYWTKATELHTIMAKTCFRIMMAGLKFNICELESSYLRNSDVVDLNERIARHVPQELQYSCLYWMSHLSGSEVHEASVDPVRQMLRSLFCETTSLYWLEVLSVMSELKAAVVILQKFPDNYKQLLEIDAELRSMTLDLYRFLMAFHEPMATSTPHIYISALLWIPSETDMAKSHCLKFNNRECVLEGLNEYWPIQLQTLSWASVVRCAVYSPDGQHIVSGSEDHSVRIWDAESGLAVGEPLRGHGDSITSVAYSPDGRHIVSGSEDNTVRIWDAESGLAVGEPLRGHDSSVLSVAYSPDGRRIVSGSEDNTVRIWDAGSGLAVGEPLRGHFSSVNLVAYSPDGRHIVSGSRDKTVRIWGAESGSAVGEPLRGHGLSVYSVAYSPDGRHIVSGSRDKTVRIWDAESGSTVGEPLRGHDSSVMSVAYSPDGRRIVSGSEDNTVRIWDAESGSAVGEPLRGHFSSVYSVAYSPDGRHVVSGSEDNTVRIWDVQSSSTIDELYRSQYFWSTCALDVECFSSSSVRGSPVEAQKSTTHHSRLPLIIPDDGWI